MRREEKTYDDSVKGVKDFNVWKKLFDLNFICVDANKDKSFMCPYHEHKCTFKSVLYFLKTDDLEEVLNQIYKELEEENKRG